MNLDIDKDWFAKKAAEEGDLEIGAGMRKTLTVDLTPEEIALLERLIDPEKSDMRARIAALEAENADLRKALIGCRSNICGYILNGSQEQADAVVQRLYEEVSRINAVACAALEAKP